MKEFCFSPEIQQRQKKVDSLKNYFSPSNKNEKLMQSYRDTSSQTLKLFIYESTDPKNQKWKLNKRKLSEFLNLVEKNSCKEKLNKILEESVYNNPNSKNNFIRILEEYKFEKGYFTNETSLNVIIPAAYFGHADIIEQFLKPETIDEMSGKGYTGLYLG